jgi:protein TonB
MVQIPQETAAALRRAFTFAVILGLHLLLIRAVWTTVIEAAGGSVPAPLRIDLIPDVRPREPPPPPVLQWQASARLQVVEPQVPVPAADDPPPVRVAEPVAPVAPPAPPAAPPAPQRGPIVAARPLYVPGGMDRYPPESRRARESGSPTIRICVSAAGMVESVEVARSSGFPRLDAAAVGIGREARFRPATQDGQPVPACMAYRIRFAFSG